jgi:hypothetical protein
MVFSQVSIGSMMEALDPPKKRPARDEGLKHADAAPSEAIWVRAFWQLLDNLNFMVSE